MGSWRAHMRVAAVSTPAAPDPLPRVRLLTRARFSMQPAIDIEAIDVETTAIVNGITRVDAGVPGTAHLAGEEPGLLEIETRAPGRQLLVVSESFHDGWRAWIDGEPASLLRAYGDYIGLVVPPGAHQVRLHFEPASFTWGARISAVALAAIGLWIAVALARSARAA
jgi:hypothetical protein